jgi:deoxyadenosine/deoxycytidine kinase
MIIELIGPAGAGKSTISKALSAQIELSKLETCPSYKKIQNIPFFIRNTLSIFSTLPQLFFCRNNRSKYLDHFVFLIMINGWHKILNAKSLNSKQVYILDQGPIYMLTFETLFGSARFVRNPSKRYWDRVYQDWADTIDLVVWLDTSLPILVERIRNRETKHGLKDVDDSYAYQCLGSYRLVYEYVVSRMLACSNKIRVLRLDTGRNSLDEAVEKIIRELHLEQNPSKLNSQNRPCSNLHNYYYHGHR